MSLFTTSYPLYSVQCLGDGMFYVAGGGGASKTGVPNALDIHMLDYDGLRHFSRELCHHDLGSRLLMQSDTCPTDRTSIAASVDTACQLYTVEVKEEENAGSDKGGSESDTVTVVEGLSVETDTQCEHPRQKVVRFVHSGDIVVTGGEDTVVRVWKYPELSPLASLSGHKEDIDDISCHPSELLAVSVSRDGAAIVWDLKKHEQLQQFHWSHRSMKYRFRACCFNKREDECSFLSVNVPVQWNRRQKQWCYLIKWSIDKWIPLHSRAVGQEMLTTVVTSGDGLVAVGDVAGNVSIYSDSLKSLMKVSAHSSIVTSLSFIVSLPKGRRVAGKGDGGLPAVLSTSIDRSCHLTVVKPTRLHWYMVVMLLTVLMLLVAVASTLVQ